MPEPKSSIYQLLARMEQENIDGALCTIVSSRGSTPRHASSKMLVFEDGTFEGTVGGGEVEGRVIQEALESIKDGRPRMLHYDMVDPQKGDPGVCGGQVEVYVEPIKTQPILLIIGGGHVGKAVAHLAHWLNFRVAVSDDRVEFCSAEANPDADVFYPVKMTELTNQIKIDGRTFILLTTRGAAIDIEGLPALLTSQAAYIGVIGSRRRWSVTRKALIEQGVSEQALDRIHSPVGLELNAETPEEIAVSILAEIIMLRNNGTGSPMKMSNASSTEQSDGG